MTISYDLLLEKLIYKKVRRTQLRNLMVVSKSILARLSKNKNGTVNVFDRIYMILNFAVSVIMSFIRKEVVD